MVAPVVNYDQLKPLREPYSRYGMMTGVIVIASYDNTHPTAGIEAHFLSLATLRVVLDGISTGAFVCRWDAATGAIFAYGANTVANAALLEAANAAAVGSVNFHAFGLAN